MEKLQNRISFDKMVKKVVNKQVFLSNHIRFDFSRYVESLKPRPHKKKIVRYESNKPIKSKLIYRQSSNQPRGLCLIDWLILHISGKIALGV